jgi:hypothetical protein
MLINGKEYEIKYTINTLCDMSTQGFDVMNIERTVINMVTIRDLLMFGLRHENKKMTKNQAGDLMDEYIADGGTFNGLVEEIMYALSRALGEDKATEEKKDKEEGNE